MGARAMASRVAKSIVREIESDKEAAESIVVGPDFVGGQGSGVVNVKKGLDGAGGPAGDTPGIGPSGIEFE